MSIEEGFSSGGDCRRDEGQECRILGEGRVSERGILSKISNFERALCVPRPRPTKDGDVVRHLGHV